MTWQTAPATPRQKSWLITLAGERMVFGPGVDRDTSIARMASEVDSMTGQDATDMITRALKAARFSDAAVPAKPYTIRYLRDTAAKKALFGLGVSREETIARVEAVIDGGVSEADARALLRTGHTAKPHPTEKSPLPLSVIEGIDGIKISEGHYAVIVDDVLRFYRVYTPTSGEWQGQAVIRRYASQNERAITPAEARDALHLIDADPDAAAYRFSDEFTRCSACGLQLTDQVSRLISVGPTCRGFTNHTGLRHAAADVDRNPARKHVFRALRAWAISQGFHDPRNREERESLAGAMTATWLASAWSGLPGLLTLDPDEAVTRCKDAITGDLHPDLRASLLAAPADTLAILVESGVLTSPVLATLSEHADPRVQELAANALMAALSGGIPGPTGRQ